MSRALYVGRFQPFHNGHLEVIKEILKTSDEVVIGIGSALDAYTADNPFTGGERYEMIIRSLSEEGIGDYYVVAIPDIHRYDLWPHHVQSLCPEFKTVYTNSPILITLFEKSGYHVKSTPMYSRQALSGKEIRTRILKGESWQDLVPPAVARYLEEIDGVSRMRTIQMGDYGVGQDG